MLTIILAILIACAVIAILPTVLWGVLLVIIEMFDRSPAPTTPAPLPFGRKRGQ